MVKSVELLAPCGSFDKLNTAIHFGADAVYVGGAKYGLRAFADNFDLSAMQKAVTLVHANGKKLYVTVNACAFNDEIEPIGEYVTELKKIGVDACIMSDLGVIATSKRVCPDMDIHLSTQASVTNYAAVMAYRDLGVSRIVLARELPMKDIAGIYDKVGDSVELEAFVHGAMCIAYSGRCLLSNYLTARSGNRGECVQACRWEYKLSEIKRGDSPLTISEDERGAYIMNSKDLCMIEYVGDLIKSGIRSFKIEGRMKSSYYVATVVNAYRRAIDDYVNGKDDVKNLKKELFKTANRGYTTGFYFKDKSKTPVGSIDDTVNLTNSQSVGDYEFVAEVKDYDDNKGALVEMRNRFCAGETLEVLSPTNGFNRTFTVPVMYNEAGEEVLDAKLVQQLLWLKTDIKLNKFDILRRRSNRAN